MTTYKFNLFEFSYRIKDKHYRYSSKEVRNTVLLFGLGMLAKLLGWHNPAYWMLLLSAIGVSLAWSAIRAALFLLVAGLRISKVKRHIALAETIIENQENFYMVQNKNTGAILFTTISGKRYPIVATSEDSLRTLFVDKPEGKEALYSKYTSQDLVDALVACDNLGGMILIDGEKESCVAAQNIKEAIDIINSDEAPCVTEFYYFHVVKTMRNKYM